MKETEAKCGKTRRIEKRIGGTFSILYKLNEHFSYYEHNTMKRIYICILKQKVIEYMYFNLKNIYIHIQIHMYMRK